METPKPAYLSMENLKFFLIWKLQRFWSKLILTFLLSEFDAWIDICSSSFEKSFDFLKFSVRDWWQEIRMIATFLYVFLLMTGVELSKHVRIYFVLLIQNINNLNLNESLIDGFPSYCVPSYFYMALVINLMNTFFVFFLREDPKFHVVLENTIWTGMESFS